MGTEAINASASIDAAAQAIEQQAAADNAAARQQIRGDFVAVAKDEKGGVGSDKAERRVDAMLNRMLPTIDFSRPGGQQSAQEIGAFVRSMGHKMGNGEIVHLEGLLSAAAAAPTAGAAQPVDPVNAQAQQAIRSDFVAVAKDDKGGVGSDKAERRVDKMLFEMLSKIDFRGPIGAGYAKEIGEFVASMGKDISKGEIAHLRGLLNDAAAASPAGSAEPAPTAPTTPPEEPAPPEPTPPTNDGDLTAKLLALLTKAIEADADGTLDSTERADLMKELAALTENMASGSGGVEKPPIQMPDTAPEGGTSKDLAALLAKITAANSDGTLDKTERADLMKELAALTKLIATDEVVAPAPAPAPAPGSDFRKDLAALLTKITAGNSDGNLDSTERADLLKALTALTERMATGGGSTVKPGSPYERPADEVFVSANEKRGGNDGINWRWQQAQDTVSDAKQYLRIAEVHHSRLASPTSEDTARLQEAKQNLADAQAELANYNELDKKVSDLPLTGRQDGVQPSEHVALRQERDASKAKLAAISAEMSSDYAATTAAAKPDVATSPPVMWTATGVQGGKSTISLGDKYELQLDEASSEMKVVNKQTKETTRIWGDPHVDWNNDGTNDVDFKHTTTFELEDKTKITIETEKWGQTEAYISDKLTITNGDNAVVVEGLGQQRLGDLKVTHSQNGAELDRAKIDGFAVKENGSGIGWLDAADDKLVTQQDFDAAKAVAQPTVADASKTPASQASDASSVAADKKDNSNDIMLGLMRLLISLLGANEDDEIDAAERGGLMKDLAGLMQKLLDDGSQAGGTTDGSSDANSRAALAGADEDRPGNKMHDANYYFQQTGLSTFLSGYNDSIVATVNKALQD